MATRVTTYGGLFFVMRNDVFKMKRDLRYKQNNVIKLLRANLFTLYLQNSNLMSHSSPPSCGTSICILVFVITKAFNLRIGGFLICHDF